MAEAAAARREARRRKILENSNNRLQLISGKSEDECHKGLVRSSVSDENFDGVLPCEPSTITLINNGPAVPEDEHSSFIAPHQANDSGDTELANDLAHPGPDTNVETPSFLHKCIANKYDIVIISLLLQLLYNLSPNIDKGYFFLPLAIYVLLKTMMSNSPRQLQFANVILMLSGLQPHKVQKVMFIFQLFAVFGQDVCVFLFSTICVQSLFVTLRNMFIT